MNIGTPLQRRGIKLKSPLKTGLRGVFKIIKSPLERGLRGVLKI